MIDLIVDGWRLRKRWFWPDAHQRILHRLLALAEQGTEVIYMPGNHRRHVRLACASGSRNPPHRGRQGSGGTFIADPKPLNKLLGSASRINNASSSNVPVGPWQIENPAEDGAIRVPDAEAGSKSYRAWAPLAERAQTVSPAEPPAGVAPLSHFGWESSAATSLGRVKVPTIIYIGGYGRGGTSMLDLMLSAAPGVLGAGELFRLWAGRLEDQCIHSASRPLAPFVEFWGEIERRVGVARVEGEHVRRLIEGRKMASRSSLGGLFHDYSCMMWKLFATLSEFGFEYVIDSSKNSRPTAFRPFYLRQCGLPLYFVHLRRGFFDTMSSVARGTNKQLLEAQSDLFRIPRAVIGFHRAHNAATRWRKEGGQAYMRLSFKRLVCDPAPEIAALCGRVGMDAGPIIDRLSRGEPFRVGYQIGGNRLFRSGEVFFRPSLPPRGSSAS